VHEDVPDAPPESAFAASISATRATLFAEPFATSSPRARRATEDFHSALIASAWRIAHDARYLHAPRFSSGRGIVGLPGLFNPDNRYSSALLDPEGTYRISGVRGTHVHLTFQFIDSYPLVGLSQDLAVIDADQLGIEPGEAFVFELGGEPRGDDWRPMPNGARAVLVRETFGDWSSETRTTLRIERLDPAGATPDGPPHAELAADYLTRMTALWSEGYLRGLRRLPVNVIPPIRASAGEAGGLRGQQGVMARFELAADEVLVVSMTATDAAYQAIQLGDPWFTTPNPLRRQSSLNRTQAAVDADGRMRFVISARDPGVANWLDTGGFDSGYVFVRWQGIQTELGPADQPVVERIRRDALADVLPAVTLLVTPEERARRLSRRAALPALQQ